MRRTKKGAVQETLVEETQGKMADESKDEGNGFFACYLLTSLSPRYKGHTYIGFTVNPKRRIRQHNGEITSGAWRTKKKRPWEMVMCIYGFPSNVTALQFEWAWQHPRESLAVRNAVASNFKTLSGLANKIKIGLTMLTLHTWQSMDLTVNFFSTKHMKHTAGCPQLPQQIKTQVRTMDDLPCYNSNSCHIHGVEEEEGDYLENDEYHYRPDGNNNQIDEDVRDELGDEYLEDDESHYRPDGINHWIDKDVREELGDDTDDSTSRICCTEEVEEDKQSANSPQEPYSISEHRGDSVSHLHPPEVDTISPICCGDTSKFAEEVEDTTIRLADTSKYTEEVEDTTIRLAEAEKSNYCGWTEPSEQLTTSTKGTTSSAREVNAEVIDLITPPDYIWDNNAPFGKKRRRAVSRTSVELIDLTRSPIFVQL